MLQYFTHKIPFRLECGQYLPELTIAYHTYGKLSPHADNVVWVCHALTGSAAVHEWWAGLFGEGRLLDPTRQFIVCANMLGSCYGSTNPLSLNPSTGQPYYHTFPMLTNRDIVAAFRLLRQHLGISRIRCLIGGSMGGQQALEWLITEPTLFNTACLLACNAQHSPWAIAFNEAQRMAIEADTSWQTSQPDAGSKGMEAARAIAMLSYRHYDTYTISQADTGEKIDSFRAASYQRYQGWKLRQRFNAFSYWTLSKAMDSHNVGRGRGGLMSALQRVQARTLVVGIRSDVLFPTREQRFIAEHIRQAVYYEIDSHYGHDGFLLDTALIEQAWFQFQEAHTTAATKL